MPGHADLIMAKKSRDCTLTGRRRYNLDEPPNGDSRGTHVQIILFNKPFNVLCQVHRSGRTPDPGGRHPIPGDYATGRLDYDSEGLLVLTDTGRIQRGLPIPRAGMAKTYWVQVEGFPTSSALQQLASGVLLKDGMTLPAVVAQIEPPPLWQRTPPIRERRSFQQLAGDNPD